MEPLVGKIVRPTVSVITAAYNSSATLRIALSSLLAQKFEDWEAWIIGDGCTDDSEGVVQSFRDARLHWENLERNHGSQAFPNNEGLRRAQGLYVAYLGHDDLWMPNHLTGMVRCIETSQADLVHSICGLFGPKTFETCIGAPKDHLGYDRHFVPPSCWLHRHSLTETVGYWSDPATLAVAVDFEYLRRISRAGNHIAFCPQLTVIKILSERIGLYSLVGDPPQKSYWERVQTDLHAFERELMTSMASDLAKRQSGGSEPFAGLVRQAIGIFKRDIRAATEQWPVFSRYWRRRYQRIRRSNLRQRGLQSPR